jgi:lysophospholipase L1-like esterase
MNKALLFYIFLLLSACNKPAPVFEKLSQDAVILSFGDSLTYGTGASKNADYPSILSELSSHEVINAGIPGEISRDGLDRLPNLLDEHQPELVILIHGGNDMLRKIPQQQTSSNLKQMIALTKQRDIKVVMLGVPKPSLFLLSSSELYQQVAEAQKTPVDLDTLPEILSSNQLKSDTIHPNNEGYRVMAENIFNFLIETGAL